MKPKNNRKKWMAGLAALVLALSTAAGGLAAEKIPAGTAGKAVQQSEESFRFLVRTDADLAAEAGMEAEQWSLDMRARTEAGRQNPVTEENLREKNPQAEILREKDAVYMIRGADGLGAIRSPEEACEAAGRVDALAGGTKDADLQLLSVMEAGDNARVYLFRQQFEGMEDLTGDRVLKIAVNAAGVPTAVFSSLVSEAPEWPEEEMTEEERPQETGDGDEAAGTETAEMEAAGDQLPQIEYPADQAFDFMERHEWSGTVAGVDGTEQTLTVPVMRDGRTGVWYLGDPERKIAVGDYASLAFGEERVQLICREQNEGWNDEDLITYANVIRVWDFYAAMGWKGPDGRGTPTLLLRNMCGENGDPIFNAAYLGVDSGWQCFAWGEDSYLGQGLDVMAHEFTHCVTEAAMGANLYQDDYGAINEAMSDILGNLCEAVVAKSGTPDWLVGEDAGMAMRSMLDPHEYGQPEHVWDLYYAPNAWIPGEANDMGGVHANSSILNLVAARLCEEYGMSLIAARNFWVTAACGMTPRTNYFQMPALLEWALAYSGNGSFSKALQACVADSRMTASAQEPEMLPEGTHLVRLTLPETEGTDGLMLVALQLDTDEVMARLKAAGSFLQTLWKAVKGGSAAGLAKAWKDTLERLNMEGLTEALLSGDPEAAKEIALGSLQGLLSEHTTWRQADGKTASMVVQNRPTIYLLMDAGSMVEEYMNPENPDDENPEGELQHPESGDPESPEMNPEENPDPETPAFSGMAVLAGDRWIDLATLLDGIPEAENEDGELTEEQVTVMMEALAEPLGNLALGLAADLLTGSQTEGGNVIDLPVTGLEVLTAPAAVPAA